VNKIYNIIISFLFLFTLSGCAFFSDEDETDINEDTVIIEDYSKALFAVRDNGSYGLVNQDGSVIVPFQHSTIDYCGSYYIAKDEDSFTIYNTDGEEALVVENARLPYYYTALYCPDDFIALDESNPFPFQSLINEKIGWISFDGDIAIAAQYDLGIGFNYYHPEIALVKSGDYFGYIDINNNEVVEIKYDEIAWESEGLVPVCKDNACGIIDLEGNIVIELMFDNPLNFNLGRAIVKIDDQYGVIDKEGNYILQTEFDYISYNENSIWILVLKDGIYSYIDWNGNLMAGPEYIHAKTFNSFGYAIVTTIQGSGVIDNMGNIVLDCEFDYIRFADSNYEYIVVGKNEIYGLYNIEGELILDLEYLYIDRVIGDIIVYKDLAWVYGLMSLEGNVLLSLNYQYIRATEDSIIYRINGLYGFMDLEGNIIIDAQYDIIPDNPFLPLGFSAVSYDGKWGVIDLSGSEVIEIKYEHVKGRQLFSNPF